MPQTACPSVDDLRAFHIGDLPEVMLTDVAAHLEICAACEAAAQTLDHVTDPVIAAYRRSARNGAVAAAMPGHVGEYEILGEIGRGGMGIVYRAQHRRLGRIVALKMLLRGNFADPQENARFRTEAEAVARLQHPNIVQLYEVGEHNAGDGQLHPFFTLEFIDGESLAARMAGRPQPPRSAAAWVEAVGRAADFAHTRGVVHRDLKPSNVLLTADGQPKLCDFGVAKLLSGSDLKTLSGAVLGTIEYMSPEQAAGDATVGPPADIYALGAILYTALTGRPPFQGTTALVTLAQVRSQEPVAPRLLVPSVPRDLNTICLKCLEKNPASRYPTAAALAEDLRRFLAGEPIVARPVTAAERACKWSKRRPALAGLLALSLVVLVVGFPGATALWLRADRARIAADQTRDQLEGAVYSGHIALADHAYQDNDIAVAGNLLTLCQPEPGRPDRRNWEWRYLNRLCHSDLVPGLDHSGKADAWVFALAFDPGGRRLVSAAGLPDGVLSGHPENACQITPGEVKLWNSDTWQRLTTFGGHAGALRAASFSSDGQWLATGSTDGHVRLWDGRTLADRGEIAACEANVNTLRFTSDSRVLIVNSAKGIVVWDMAQSRRRFTFAKEFPRGFWPALAVSPAGCIAFCGVAADGRMAIQLRDLQSGEEVKHQIPGMPLNALAFSPDGQFLALAGPNDHRIQIWDAPGNRLVRQLTGHTNNVIALAFCPDGRLISAGDDRTVRVWDASTGAEVCQFRGHAMGVQCLAVSPDGRRLAAGDKTGAIKIWDLTRNPRAQAFKAGTGGGEYVDDLSFSEDGHDLIVVSDRVNDQDIHNIAHWESATARLRDQHAIATVVLGEKRHRTYAFSGDSRRVAGVDWTTQKSVTVFATADARREATFQTRDVPIGAVSLNRDASRIAYAGWDVVGPVVPRSSGETNSVGRAVRAELIVADVVTGQEIFRPVLPLGHIITRVAIDSAGQHLACVVRAVDVGPETLGSESVRRAPTTSIYIWTIAGPDSRTPTEPLILEGSFDGVVTCLTFSLDGKWIAAAGTDGTVREWNSNTGRSVFKPVQESRPATGLAFSPDGQRLAGAATDGQVHIWDAVRGERLLSLHSLGRIGTGHYGFTARVVFSPDGTKIAANDWDSTVTIWDAGKSEK